MDANEHLDRIIADLKQYQKSNKRLAVDEAANAFEEAVNAHDQLAALLDRVQSATKPLAAEERQMRDGIAASLIAFFKDGLTEGVNTYVLSNLRKLKFTYKVERKVDMAMVAVAREKFAAAEDKVGTFDQLVRVKMELEVKPYRKLPHGGAAWLAISEMLVSKPAAPTIEVD